MSNDPLVRYLENPTDPEFVRLMTETGGLVYGAAYAVHQDHDLARDNQIDTYVKVHQRPWLPEKVHSGPEILYSTSKQHAETAAHGEDRRHGRERSTPRRETRSTTSRPCSISWSPRAWKSSPRKSGAASKRATSRGTRSARSPGAGASVRADGEEGVVAGTMSRTSRLSGQGIHPLEELDVLVVVPA